MRRLFVLVVIAGSVLAVGASGASASATGRPATAFHAGGQVVSSGTSPTTEFFTTGHQGAEPAIGVDPAGHVFFNYVTGTTAAGAVVLTPGVLVTTNGTSFQDISPKVGSLHEHPLTEDPYMYVDPMTGRVFEADLFPPCSATSFSRQPRSLLVDDASRLHPGGHRFRQSRTCSTRPSATASHRGATARSATASSDPTAPSICRRDTPASHTSRSATMGGAAGASSKLPTTG